MISNTSESQAQTLLSKSSRLDFWLVVLLIANTAFPFFYRPIEPIILTFLFLIAVMYSKGMVLGRLPRQFYIFVVMLGVILIIKVLFNSISLLIFGGVVLRVLYAYFVLIILGEKLIPLFLKAMYSITVLSFIFYFSALISPSIYAVYKSICQLVTNHFPFSQGGAYVNDLNMLVHDFGQMYLYRNSGPFWEPGAFAGFLLIALFFNLIVYGKIFNQIGVILMAGVATTLSTNGYLVLFLFLLYYFVIYSGNLKFLLIIGPLFVFVVLNVYTKVSFLDKKIRSHLMEIDRGDRISSKTRKTRFVSFYLDFTSALASPLVGSLDPIRKKGKEIDMEEHRTNGLGSLMKSYGFVFFFFYFYAVHFSLKKVAVYFRQRKSLAIVGVILIMLLGFSEPYFGLIFFWLLPLLFIAYPYWSEIDEEDYSSVLMHR